jgi:all-trans-retinol 13,14-reductase
MKSSVSERQIEKSINRQTAPKKELPCDRHMDRRAFLKTLALASSAALVDWNGMGALADSVKNKGDFPVVVIGSGLGGLVCGAYLSRFGFDVTMLEQHSIPGGYATAFDRGDFTFDVSLHATVAEHAMPQMILEDLGLWKHLDVAYTPELRRIITDRFDITLPAKDPEGVKSRLSERFPREKTGIHGFYTQMEQVISELWGGGASQSSIMEKLEHLTLSQWMDQHVSDPDVKTCMAVFSGYYGLPPEELNALFYAIATGEYLVHGGQYYKARSQDLSDTLAQGIQQFNGRIHYNTRAKQILFNPDKTITGVKDHKGTVYPARAVIANCPVPALVNTLVPPSVMPASFAAQARQRRTSLSSFVVWLGLNRPVPGIKDYEIDLAGTAETAETSGKGLFNSADLAESGIGVTIYDNLFQGYSAQGKTTMTFICLSDYARWQEFETDYFNNEKQAYNKEKERIAARFIQRVEKALIPGLSGMIEEMEIGTPLTNVFYTGNTGGAIYGYDRNLPHLESRTPVKGLYLASAWSHGGGYTPVMMGGRQTAQQVIKDFKGA